MESVNGLYKAECIRTTVFCEGPDKTLVDVEFATAGWVDWSTTAVSMGRLATSHRSSTNKPNTLPSTPSLSAHESGREPGRFTGDEHVVAHTDTDSMAIPMVAPTRPM